MNRLEEIKERVNKTALHQQEWSDNYRGDVLWLIDEVERLNREVSDLTDACRQWREYAEGKRNEST